MKCHQYWPATPEGKIYDNICVHQTGQAVLADYTVRYFDIKVEGIYIYEQPLVAIIKHYTFCQIKLYDHLVVKSHVLHLFHKSTVHKIFYFGRQSRHASTFSSQGLTPVDATRRIIKHLLNQFELRL